MQSWRSLGVIIGAGNQCLVSALALILLLVICEKSRAAVISDKVKESVRSRVDGGKTVGVVIGLVDQEGVDYFCYGKKTASGNASLSSGTVFEIGSISKAFTGILLADAVARGEVAFADSIEKHLPEGIKVPNQDGVSISLEQLSVQTSGLPRMPSNFAPADPKNPYADYDAARLYSFLGEIQLERGIGEAYEYSNVGVGLLGHLLERASGATYEHLVVDRIARVLAMPDTAMVLSELMKARLAKGHLGGQEVPNWDFDIFAAAGGIRSTAADMIRFLEANLGLRESPLLASMRQSHQARASAGMENMKIGLGWHIRIGEEGRESIWHNGGTGGYRCFAGFVQDPPLGAVVLTNSGGAGDDDIGFHLLDESSPLTELIKRDEVTIDVEILNRYVGVYEINADVNFDIRVEGGQLLVQLTGQPRIPVFPQSETEFFYRVVEARITFNVDETDAVTGLTLHQGGQAIEAKKIE